MFPKPSDKTRKNRGYKTPTVINLLIWSSMEDGENQGRKKIGRLYYSLRENTKKII